LQQSQDADGIVQGITPESTLDLRGHATGQASLLLLRNALDRLLVGQVLELRLSQDGTLDDVKAWLRLAGHEVIADLDASDHTRLLVRRQSTTREKAADWGARAPLRADGGFDLRDWLQGRFGQVPDEAPTYYGFVPRGAVMDSGGPEFPYVLNRKDDVWSDNLADLYEQAKAQQWNATTDIPWHDLPALPDHIERAVCQIMTFLAENEYAALYIPAKFLPRINAQFIEPVLFLATVINDEARHIEAFMKRALANGGAPQYSAALTEWSLHSLLVQEDYFRSSFLLHVLGEGTFLDLLDFIERHAPDGVTAEVVRRARLDEGRHVAYGIAHVRHVLERQPAKADALVAAAEERSEALRAASGANPMMIEALATLAAGGETTASAREAGFAVVQQLFQEMHEYRVRRMLQVGLQRDVAEKISNLHTPNFM
jgi:TusA-related sulfurtransferase